MNSSTTPLEIEPTWFDYEVKKAYFETVTEKQRPYLYHLFRTMNPQEVSLQTPLYNQTAAQLESFFFSLRPLTMKTSYKGISATIRYIRYAIEQGHRQTNILFVTNSNEYARQFIPRNATEYITNTQLDSLIDGCANYQDKIIFQMLFEGFKGDQLYELRHLKIEDIDRIPVEGSPINGPYKATVSQHNRKTRTMMISEKLYLMCVQASLQIRYKLNNGYAVDDYIQAKRGNYQYLNDAGFILKRSRIGAKARNSSDPIGYHGLYSRMKRIMSYDELDGIDPDYLKPQSVYDAGALYAAYNMIKQSYQGKIPFDDLPRVEKHKIYDQADLLSIRKTICEHFVYLRLDRSKHVISEDNLKKYYA